MRDLAAHYQTLCQHMNFRNQGMILATGCCTVSRTKQSPFADRAYALEKSL